MVYSNNLLYVLTGSRVLPDVSEVVLLNSDEGRFAHNIRYHCESS